MSVVLVMRVETQRPRGFDGEGVKGCPRVGVKALMGSIPKPTHFPVVFHQREQVELKKLQDKLLHLGNIGP